MTEGGRERVRAPRTRSLVVALLTFVLAFAGTLVAPAQAFTPAALPPTSTSTVTVDASHTPTNSHPKQGENVNYQFDFTFAGMSSPDVTRTTTITIHADANAPFSAAGAFTFASAGSSTFGALPSGASVSASPNCSATTCTYTVTGLGDGTLRLARQATVAAGLADGTLIMASADASVSPEGRTTLANVDATPLIGTCSGPYNFVQRVDDGGAWLVDIKFGDELGNGKVFLSPGDRTIQPWTAGTSATDWIRFTGPNGEDLTQDVTAQATYLANDPSAARQTPERTGPRPSWSSQASCVQGRS